MSYDAIQGSLDVSLPRHQKPSFLAVGYMVLLGDTVRGIFFPTLWPHMQRYFGRRPKNARLRDADRYAFQVEADLQMASLMKRDEYHALHAWFDLFDEPNKAEVRAKPKGHGALLQKRQKAELYQASVRGAEVG